MAPPSETAPDDLQPHLPSVPISGTSPSVPLVQLDAEPVQRQEPAGRPATERRVVWPPPAEDVDAIDVIDLSALRAGELSGPAADVLGVAPARATAAEPPAQVVAVGSSERRAADASGARRHSDELPARSRRSQLAVVGGIAAALAVGVSTYLLLRPAPPSAREAPTVAVSATPRAEPVVERTIAPPAVSAGDTSESAAVVSPAEAESAPAAATRSAARRDDADATARPAAVAAVPAVGATPASPAAAPAGSRVDVLPSRRAGDARERGAGEPASVDAPRELRPPLASGQPIAQATDRGPSLPLRPAAGATSSAAASEASATESRGSGSTDSAIADPRPAASGPTASIASSAATTAPPASAAAPPPAAAAPIPAVNAEAEIRDALARYRVAYDRLDAGAARAVWPAVDERALARAFSGLRSQRLDFEQCRVTASGASATASCTGRATFVTRVGKQDPQVEPRAWTFRLQRGPSGWQIASAAVSR